MLKHNLVKPHRLLEYYGGEEKKRQERFLKRHVATIEEE
jgi:hypothetical protein